MTYNLMTEETPAKVLGLLGVALTSMFFLFTVTVSNANFTQTQNAFPDPFSPAKVMAFLDNTSNSYSNFVNANLVQPAQNDYAIYQYNLKYVIDEAGPSILAYTGLSSYAENTAYQAQATPQVAGAFTSQQMATSRQPDSGGFSIDTIYNALIR
jgi:hypothetical protein